MTKAQLKTLEQLREDKDFKGKKMLNYLIWLNTTTPKYKVGDCFKVSDRGHRVYGQPIRDFNAKVTKIEPAGFMRQEYRYTLEIDVKSGCAGCTVTVYKDESELHTKCKDNKVDLGAKADTSNIEELDI